MAYTRARNLFDPTSATPFRLSRSKIENFIACPRCFYLDRRLGVKQPDMFAFTLNNAVDYLLKKEFDIHRAAGRPHPLMRTNGLDAVPLQHPEMNVWRENFTGMQYLHEPTNFLITGAIDDVWVRPDGELIIVDYKATSTTATININDDYKASYRRQMAIYQWLFRHAGFRVSRTGYFVYVNGRTDTAAFDAKLEFNVQLIPYECDDTWVDGTLQRARDCLMQSSLPDSADTCDYCAYRRAAHDAEQPKQQTLFAIEAIPTRPPKRTVRKIR